MSGDDKVWLNEDVLTALKATGHSGPDSAVRALLVEVERLRRERDDLGPFFVRDIARLAGLPDDAWMDEIAKRVAALAEASEAQRIFCRECGASIFPHVAGQENP